MGNKPSKSRKSRHKKSNSDIITISQRQKITVSGYIRIHYAYNKQYPKDITHLIFSYYLTNIDSTILSSNQQFLLLDLIHNTLKQSKPYKNLRNIDMSLLYRASDHDYSSVKFHELCDKKGATLTIIHNEYDHIFGGFANESWNIHELQITDPNAFLFSIKPKIKVFRLKQEENDGDEALANYQTWGPIFGKGNDIIISDKCDDVKNAYRTGCKSVSFGFKADEFCGAEIDGLQETHFVVKDYEVFSINVHSI